MATEIESPVSDVAGKIKNKKLLKWVEEAAAMCKPDRVRLCDGSDQEYELMTRLMLQSGTAIPLNLQKRPNSIFVRSTPVDVARVEDRTYICSETQAEAGPNNNWEDPVHMKRKLTELFTGSMSGRYQNRSFSYPELQASASRPATTQEPPATTSGPTPTTRRRARCRPAARTRRGGRRRTTWRPRRASAGGLPGGQVPRGRHHLPPVIPPAGGGASGRRSVTLALVGQHLAARVPA